MFSGQAHQHVTRIKNFGTVKKLAIWAGLFGVVQSLAWIGLTITGILAYNCVISVAAQLSYGSLLRTIFLDVYFKGFTGCTPSVYQQYNYTMIKSVPTVLDPEQILIWDCVYLAVAVCWFISSLLLFFFVRKDNAPVTLGVIHTWVFLVCAVSCMDLALGIIFGIDYGQFQNAAYNYNFNSINQGAIDPNAAQLLAGEVAAISMMIISFKGFVIWIINVVLMGALFLQGVIIARQNTDEGTLFRPRKDSDDVLTTRPPIFAFEEKQKASFTNEAFVPDNRSMGTIELNEEAIVRAAHLSRDANLLERRFRNIDSYKQYSPAATGTGSRDTVSEQETVIMTAALPAPDYSPQVSRIGPNQQNGMRSQKF